MSGAPNHPAPRMWGRGDPGEGPRANPDQAHSIDKLEDFIDER